MPSTTFFTACPRGGRLAACVTSDLREDYIGVGLPRRGCPYGGPLRGFLGRHPDDQGGLTLDKAVYHYPDKEGGVWGGMLPPQGCPARPGPARPGGRWAAGPPAPKT